MPNLPMDPYIPKSTDPVGINLAVLESSPVSVMQFAVFSTRPSFKSPITAQGTSPP